MRAERIETESEATRLHLREVGGVRVVVLQGLECLFDEDELDELGRRLYRLVEEGCVVVVDLRGAQYISSGVVARLAWLHRRLGNAHGRLLICGLTPLILHLFRLCGLDRVLEISTEDAELVVDRWMKGLASSDGHPYPSHDHRVATIPRPHCIPAHRAPTPAQLD
jgi:anti-anti-sigma factor